MKKACSSVFVFLMACCATTCHLNAQEWYNGVLYHPLPIPEWSVSPSSDTAENLLLVYSLTNGDMSHAPKNTEAVNVTDHAFEPDNVGLGNSDVSGVSDRNFSNLSPTSNIQAFPARTAVKLFMTFPNGGNYVGSGTLIDSRFVLTAGHCIHDKNLGGWVSSITIIPAYDYGSAPFGNARGQFLYSWSNWTNNRDFNWDLGMIKLDRYIGGLTGWMGYGYNTANSFFSNKTFFNHSFPAASPFNGEQMQYQNGTFDEINNRVLYYKKQGFGGQSGSGMYESNRVVYAALSHGASGPKTGSVRLSPDIFNYFRDEIAKAKPNSANLTPLAVKAVGNNLIAGCEKFQQVSAVIHNYSESAFNGSVPVRIYLSSDGMINTADRLIRVQIFPLQIAANASTTVTITDVLVPGIVPQGQYSLGVWLDVGDALGSDNGTRDQDNVGVSIRAAKTLSTPAQNQVLSAEEGCFQMEISSNATWEVCCVEPWITSIAPNTGSGNAIIEVCYAANKTPFDRSSPLLIKGQCLLPRVIGIKQHFEGMHVYPNPINGPNSKIRYTLQDSTLVTIRLYNALGQTLITLINNEFLPQGDHELTHDFSPLPNGTYILAITAGKQKYARRIVKGY